MIKIIIWLLAILLFGSMILEIYKDFIFETMSYPLVQARFVLGFILGFSLFYVISEGIKSKEKRLDAKFTFFVIVFFVVTASQILNTVFLKSFFNYTPTIHLQFFKFAGLGLIAAIIFQRIWIAAIQKFTSNNTTYVLIKYKTLEF